MDPQNDNAAQPTESKGNYDEFSSIFEELTLPVPSSKTDGDQSPAGTDAADPAAKSSADASSGAASDPAKAAAADATSVPAGTDSTAEGKPPATEAKDGAPATPPAADGQPPAATPAADEKDWKAEAARLQAELEAANARAKEAASSDKGASAQGDEPAKPEPAKPVYSDEEKTVLDAYKKEWPDVARGESLARRAEYQQIVAYVFDQIARAYGPLLERAVQGTDAIGADLAVRTIQSAHRDYNDAMHDAVAAWANTLSGTRKKVALAVIESGEPEEVIDLIRDYKEAKGIKDQPGGDTPAAQPPAAVAGRTAAGATKSNVTQLTDAAKKAATAMGVVDTKRTSANPGSTDPNDFDGAWEEAVSAK